MPTGQYGAALMQAYLRKATLAWISKHSGIPIQLLRQWRKEPQFLLVMDWSKSVFSAALQENLILNDYSVAQYHYMAAEISLLEESVRVAVRVPLDDHLQTLLAHYRLLPRTCRAHTCASPFRIHRVRPAGKGIPGPQTDPGYSGDG
jgi:hypothetical protein